MFDLWGETNCLFYLKTFYLNSISLLWRLKMSPVNMSMVQTLITVETCLTFMCICCILEGWMCLSRRFIYRCSHWVWLHGCLDTYRYGCSLLCCKFILSCECCPSLYASKHLLKFHIPVFCNSNGFALKKQLIFVMYESIHKNTECTRSS